MQRKTMGLFVALVAFGAFALVPAISSAHGLLDTKGGETTTAGLSNPIAAYNEAGTAWKFIAASLTIECQETTLLGRVTTNPHTTGGAVEATIEDAFLRGHASNTQCTSAYNEATITIPALTQAGGASHWCLRTIPNTNNFAIEPHNCGGTGGEFTFLFHFTEPTPDITCGYTRMFILTGTFTTPTNHTASTLTLDKNQLLTKHAGGILCPSSGELAEFKFEMFTDTAGTTPGTWRDAKNVADPIWIT